TRTVRGEVSDAAGDGPRGAAGEIRSITSSEYSVLSTEGVCTMRILRWTGGILALAVAFGLGWMLSNRTAALADKEEPTVKGWTKGKGWGGWGEKDEVGSLNAMTPESIKKALALVKTGKVYDLGVPYDRQSFKWPGHSPGEIIMYRSPEGVKREGDFKPAVTP